MPAPEDPGTWLPGNSLLLQPGWIRANAQALLSISTDALAISDDGQHATRTVRASIATDSDVSRTDRVVYDLVLRDGETQKNRDDKHRRREEECIRRLDAGAAEAHRARRAREQRSRRAPEAAVREVLEYTIVKLKQQLCYSKKRELNGSRSGKSVQKPCVYNRSGELYVLR